MDNYEQITRCFRILRDSLSAYITRELEIAFGVNWWDISVLQMLQEEQKRNLPVKGHAETLADSFDILVCLTLIADVHWNKLFRNKLTIDHRTLANELKGIRNKWAHWGGGDFSDEDTWRALDTMSRITKHIDPEASEKIRTMFKISMNKPTGNPIVICSDNTNFETRTPRGENEQTVFSILKKLQKSEQLNNVLLENLQNTQYTNKNFKISSYPFLVTQNELALHDYERKRFYKNTFTHNGITYFVCSQWIPKRINLLKNWSEKF